MRGLFCHKSLRRKHFRASAHLAVAHTRDCPLPRGAQAPAQRPPQALAVGRVSLHSHIHTVAAHRNEMAIPEAAEASSRSVPEVRPQ